MNCSAATKAARSRAATAGVPPCYFGFSGVPIGVVLRSGIDYQRLDEHMHSITVTPSLFELKSNQLHMELTSDVLNDGDD